jgi:hypothetical protein
LYHLLCNCLILSQPKSAIHQQAAKLFQQQLQQWKHLKGSNDLSSAFENASRLIEQKRTGSKFQYIVPLTLQTNLCWHLRQVQYICLGLLRVYCFEAKKLTSAAFVLASLSKYK